MRGHARYVSFPGEHRRHDATGVSAFESAENLVAYLLLARLAAWQRSLRAPLQFDDKRWLSRLTLPYDKMSGSVSCGRVLVASHFLALAIGNGRQAGGGIRYVLTPRLTTVCST